MKFKIITLFPNIITNYLKYSIIGKSIEKGIISVEVVNLREYSDNKHNKVDDKTYGGGPGMLLSCIPIHKAILDCKGKTTKIIFLSPKGMLLNQKKVKLLSQEKELLLICGFYEGFDARVFNFVEHEKISIGDYILANGSLAAMVLLESVSRICKNVLNNSESCIEETFNNNLIEYDQYTAPTSYNGAEVPEVLLSGNHARIKDYRRKTSILNTLNNRPDLLEKARLSLSDLDFLISYVWGK